ncbi:MAG: MBL fold metallo-hydrolase [Acidobacteria bacterium]|nr:MBL fold metallo-hydrolase [Acidobacteriota bacterium]
MKWGDFELHLISDGHLWLDGGAMFGVVPRVLWEKKTRPDDRHRICLAMNCLLVRTGAQNILIDTGCGHKYSEKEMEIYNIDHFTDVPTELGRLGLGTDRIDLVINTHFHFDHCGGNTVIRNGRAVPTFPKATYAVRRRELEDASAPNERTSASYFSHNWQPLLEEGRLRVIDSDEDKIIAPGITLVPTPGHTAGHQSVKIESGGKTLFYLGDLCPTTAHVPLPWIMGFDVYPLTTLEVRRKIYREAMEKEWMVFFEHDPTVHAGYLRWESGRYFLQPQAWTP